MIKVSFEWGLQVEKEGVAMATIFLTGKKLFTFGHYFPDAPRILIKLNSFLDINFIKFF